jgi:hypothetical protein
MSNNQRELIDMHDWAKHYPEEAREIGRNARKNAIEKFHIDRFKNDWMLLLNKVLAK